MLLSRYNNKFIKWKTLASSYLSLEEKEQSEDAEKF